MARMVVKSFPAPGFDGVFRGGRKWPASGTLVETSDDDGDVEAAGDKPLVIGKRTLAALKSDPGRISFAPEQGPEEIDALRRELEETKAKLAAASAPPAPPAPDPEPPKADTKAKKAKE